MAKCAEFINTLLGKVGNEYSVITSITVSSESDVPYMNVIVCLQPDNDYETYGKSIFSSTVYFKEDMEVELEKTMERIDETLTGENNWKEEMRRSLKEQLAMLED